MLRRFNYTGRKKIPRSAITVKLSNDGLPVPTFDAKFDLSALKLPGHAKIYVEAYHRASYMRFDYGQVSDVRPPKDRRLMDIEGGGTAQFRLKVIDETTKHGCVLAEAEGITPLDADEAAANRKSILPVVITDLDDQVWRIDFDSPDGRPVLELNKRIDGVSRLAAGDDQFFSLTYPAVLRQIVHRILRIEQIADVDGPADDWRVQWLQFCCSLPGILAPPKPDDDDDESVEQEQLNWVEDVAAAFCLKFKILERYNRAVVKEDE
ncbi:MAG: hypothetical protein J5I93_09625 [Pirellulaceae bacterium]|nr:hypothetical protein [Pirellulaceae bacterium]